MNSLIASLLITTLAAIWLYPRLQNRSGQNTQQSMIVTAIGGGLLFVGLFIILSLVF